MVKQKHLEEMKKKNVAEEFGWNYMRQDGGVAKIIIAVGLKKRNTISLFNKPKILNTRLQ